MDWSCGEKQLLHLLHVEHQMRGTCLPGVFRCWCITVAAFLSVCCVPFPEDGNIRIGQLGIWDDCLTLVVL